MKTFLLTPSSPAGPIIDPLHRGRPVVSNGTVHTDTGIRLHGCTMDIRKQATPPCTQQAVWNAYRALGLNLVRLGVKTDADGVGRPLAQQLPYLDAAVECAWAARMYIMPLVSVNPGTYNLAQLTAFWSVVAGRYKDRTHVLYEMTNEPTSGGGYWGATAHWTTPKLTDLRSVYNIMRSGAPNTPIVLFSSTNLYPSPTSWKTVPQTFESLGSPIDWSKALLGYHHYPGTYLFGDPNGFGGLQAMKALGYNLLMTECNDFIWKTDGNDGPSKDPRNQQQVWLWMEQNDISWVCLDGKAGNVNTQIVPEIIPYLNLYNSPLTVE